VSGIADSGAKHPQLLPKFKLADGSELIATAYEQDIQAKPDGSGYRVTYHQDALDRLGQKGPVKDTRITVETSYSLQHGVITRTDTYRAASPLDVAGIAFEFASFSSGAGIEGNTVNFKDGAVRSFTVNGLQSCQAAPTNGSALYQAPYGPMASVVSCASSAFRMDKPLTISWTIRYQ
jgi:hypothetical protein